MDPQDEAYTLIAAGLCIAGAGVLQLATTPGAASLSQQLEAWGQQLLGGPSSTPAAPAAAVAHPAPPAPPAHPAPAPARPVRPGRR